MITRTALVTLALLTTACQSHQRCCSECIWEWGKEAEILAHLQRQHAEFLVLIEKERPGATVEPVPIKVETAHRNRMLRITLDGRFARQKVIKIDPFTGDYVFPIEWYWRGTIAGSMAPENLGMAAGKEKIIINAASVTP